MQHLVSDLINWLKEYRRRPDNVAKKFHRELCKKNGLEHMKNSYEHVLERAVENEEVKVLWDINVQCNPDIIVIVNKERKGIIIDIAIPATVRVGEKKGE